MNKKHLIFDLDGTTVNSSHRQRLINGKLDLEHWKANAIRSKIMQDTLLPLSKVWLGLQDKLDIFVCTARNIADADIEFLARHGLRYTDILSRPLGDSSSDPILKVRLLRNMYSVRKLDPLQGLFFDDKQENLDAVSLLGVKVYKACY